MIEARDSVRVFEWRCDWPNCGSTERVAGLMETPKGWKNVRLRGNRIDADVEGVAILCPVHADKRDFLTDVEAAQRVVEAVESRWRSKP